MSLEENTPENHALSIEGLMITRGRQSPVGTVPYAGMGSGMEYRLVCHLFSSTPLHKTPAAYTGLKPILEARGTSLDNL